MAPVSCSICTQIGDGATANTGRDEYFGPPVTLLKPIFKSRDDDLWQCPECGALFFWNEYIAFTGSGNNDEDTVTRLDEPLQAALRELTQRSDDTPEQIEELAAHLFQYSEKSRDLLLGYLARHRDVLPALVPHYLAEAARRNNQSLIKDLEFRTARDREFAKVVLAAIEASPSPLFEALANIARLAQCSVCGTYTFQTFKQGEVPPTHARFERLTDTTSDIWECTECGTFFEWEPSNLHAGDQHLQRVAEWQAKTLRILLHRTSPDAIDDKELADTMFWSQHEQSVLMSYAIERDRTLARPLARLMVVELAKTQKPWLLDLLTRFIAGHQADAALVLSAIQTIPPEYREAWHQPMIEQLAARCRDVT